VVNPLAAVCEDGFLPDELYVLENPGIDDQFDEITSMMERVVVKYGGDDPDLSVTHLDEETDFQRIVDHFRGPISQVRDDGGTVAVDITPGRKFMSEIAFQARIQFKADNVFYLYLAESQFYGRIYETNCRTHRLPGGLRMELARHRVTHLLTLCTQRESRQSV